jgi:GTP-binding protein EngB required for normal cell division
VFQVSSAHLVSSHSGEGIAAVTSKLCRERKGRDVFVVGAANVGKSAFVRAMLKEMSRWGAVRGLCKLLLGVVVVEVLTCCWVWTCW